MFLALEGFWLIVVSLIVFIFIIGIIIIVHEFGHFLVARKSGILCHEFSIGMGPCVYKKQFKNTLFCLRAIPIGGYVQMADDETSILLTKGDKVYLDIEDDEITKISLIENSLCDVIGTIKDYDFENKLGDGMTITISSDDDLISTFKVRNKAIIVLDKNTNYKIASYKETFSGKPLWQRFLTLAAGPCMNFILAILIYFIYFCALGVPNYDSNVIGEVGYGYASYNILNVGDKIVSVEGKDVTSWQDFEIIIDDYNKNYPASINLGIEDINGNYREEEIEYSIIINSIGLSNLENYGLSMPDDITSGVLVGNVALNYNNKNANPTNPLSRGDVILSMRVDPYLSANRPTIGEEIVVDSWSDIINNLKDVDVAEVRFSYYDTDSKTIIKIDESEPLITWGNETLTNQKIEKIELKLGISPTYHFSLGGVLKSTFSGFWSDFTLVFRTLKLLIAPSGIRQVGVSNLTSVVGIFDMVKDLVQTGILPILAFTAMLSVNIGIVNLLPIPALDGGRIIFLLYELITHKKPNKKFEAILNAIFFFLLIILFLYVTYNDILRFNLISFNWRL